MGVVTVLLYQAAAILNHGPTVLVTGSHAGRSNVMASLSNLALAYDPPLLSIAIASTRYTRELIDPSGSFAFNLPCRAQADMVVKVGSTSGRELLGRTLDNKFSAFELLTFSGSQIQEPLLRGCVA